MPTSKQNNNDGVSRHWKRLYARKARRQKLIRIIVRLFIWTGAAVIYYAAFSFFFDTPAEYNERHSTDFMRREYKILEARYDSLEMVLDNLSERDRNVFNILFESSPYAFDSEYETERLNLRERLISESNGKLRKELGERTAQLEATFAALQESHKRLAEQTEALGDDGVRHIPSIQPVINKNLTLLTAGYGMIMHPFYRTLRSHQGVDYTVPEGSPVFATADGIVKEVSERNSTFGQSITIDHENGYVTQYSHLMVSLVRKGQRVRRGDIIARSGNSGLSLSPHLHYEIRIDGMRVDPIHYFFTELSHAEYQRIIRIAQSGMQSFD
ncbi:MAG: M23 family metallopeptidase [Alistipes sp.]|nr:M23 family metallopeptidase [Alistipes sp.]